MGRRRPPFLMLNETIHQAQIVGVLNSFVFRSGRRNEFCGSGGPIRQCHQTYEFSARCQSQKHGILLAVSSFKGYSRVLETSGATRWSMVYFWGCRRNRLAIPITSLATPITTAPVIAPHTPTTSTEMAHR